MEKLYLVVLDGGFTIVITGDDYDRIVDAMKGINVPRFVVTKTMIINTDNIITITPQNCG